MFHSTKFSTPIKIVFSLIIFLSFSGKASYACSAFSFTKNSVVVMGKSYDWSTNIGVLMTNPKGKKKLAYPTGVGEPFSWVSKYGSITFNQIAQNLPNGGLNEKGLAIEVLWLNDTEYCSRDNGKTLNELQWVQYQLDNCASVDEVIETNKDLYIVPIFAKLHFYVADKSGNAAVIEYINGEFKVYTKKNLPFKGITNDTYEASANYFKNIANFKNKRHNASVNRFSRVVENIKKYENESNDSSTVDLAFDVLDKVWVRNWTKWNIVYDLTNLKIHFKTNDYIDIKTVDFNAHDFSENASVKILNINNILKNDVTNKFENFTKDANLALLKNSVRIIGVPFSDEFVELLASYPENYDETMKAFTNRNDTIGNLVVEISNLKVKMGYIYLGIYKGEQNYEKRRNFNGSVSHVNNETVRITLYNIPLNNEYAIGFYHDENNNRKLDNGMFGIPKEGFGFSNNKGRKYHKAKFVLSNPNQVLKLKAKHIL